MKKELEKIIATAIKDLFGVEIDIELSRPDEKFGDYATNIALQLAAKIKKPLAGRPREIAEKLKEKLETIELLSSAEIAGPGFINLRLRDEVLFESLLNEPSKSYKSQEVLIEFGDPNPFKEMHIAHLYSYIVGDAIANMLEEAGASVRRLSYHGDVGLHVAKAIWGMQKAGVDLEKNENAVSQNIGQYYTDGARAYEENEKAKIEIHKINKHIYKKNDPLINKLYEKGREISFHYFDDLLKDLNIKSDRRYLESETVELGMEIVRANVGKVFKQSEGAVVYKGEKAGLHTRVFITSKGLPTYETKDLGLAELKRREFPNASRSIIITANEQAEYFKVMLTALSEFDEPLASSITHLSHGFISLSTGKMSSRIGNVYSGLSAIADIEKEIEKRFPKAPNDTRNAAIKYDFLKRRLGSDFVYDVEESFSLEGNSGPYLQYAYARARSILVKSQFPQTEKQAKSSPQTQGSILDSGERLLALKISEYPEIIDKSVEELMPHHICGYLYELAQKFNSFYEHSRVIGDARQNIRVELVESYADTLKNGLKLLGISSPERL